MVFKKGQKAWNKINDGLTRTQRHYQRNKQQINLRNKNKSKEYRIKHKEELDEYHKKYREENRIDINRKMREYTKRPEVKRHRRVYNNQYWIENKEKLLEDQRIRQNKNYERYNKKVKEWVKNNPQKVKLERERGKNNQKIYRLIEKEVVLEHYSGKPIKCNCCMEKNIEFLSIDHINSKEKYNHKKRLTGNKLYKWIMENKYPEGFQVLCMNCNVSKGFSGICAHKGNIEKKPKEGKIYKDWKSLKSYYKKENQETRKRLKYEVFSYYSRGKPKCECCKIEQIDFLTIEHIDGRKNAIHDNRKGGYKLCGWLKLNNYPKDLKIKILCFNCNWGSRLNIGKCPHKFPNEIVEHLFNQ